MSVFWTIVAVLVVVWLVGVLASFTMRGLLHGLPVVAMVLVVIRLASGTIQASLGADAGVEPDHERAVGKLGS